MSCEYYDLSCEERDCDECDCQHLDEETEDKNEP